MLEAKEWVLDRIEQSFMIFIKNPIALVLPLAIFQIIFIGIIPTFWMNIIFQSNFLNSLSMTSQLYSIISLWVIYIFLYLMLIIPLTLGTMKWVVDVINWKEIQSGEIIRSGFLKISDAFKVYWYMFTYAYLIPAICFIASGIILIYGLYFGSEIASSLWWILVVISTLFAIVWCIYRWLKSSFALSSAIQEKDFSQHQFNKSISYTHKNWWRILWNFMLIWVIATLLSWLISWVTWSLSLISESDIDIVWILQNRDESLQDIVSSMWNVDLMSLINTIISQIIWSIITVFVMIFSVIFYLRLKMEFWDTHQKDVTIEKKQLGEL